MPKVGPRSTPMPLPNAKPAAPARSVTLPNSLSSYRPTAGTPLVALSPALTVTLPKVDPTKFNNIDQYKEVGPDRGKGPNPYCAPTDVLMAARYFAEILPGTQYVNIEGPDGKPQTLPTSGDTATLVKGLYERYGTTKADNGTNRDELVDMLAGAGLQTVAENKDNPKVNDAIVNVNGKNVVNDAFIRQHLNAGHPVMVHGDGHG